MTSEQRATAAHAVPFAAYVGIMALGRAAGLSPLLDVPLRFGAAALILFVLSRPYIELRPSRPVASALLGIAVFLVWIGPDVLFGYRHFWLFENSLTGRAESSITPALRAHAPFLVLRVASAALLVPIMEELFWRGWLMRWLIRPSFLEVRFGAYQPFAFWTVAVLFGSEHGPYWEVGLAAGVLYNWWAIRTKRLADCILAHAVTNAILSAYVLLTGEWQYWL